MVDVEVPAHERLDDLFLVAGADDAWNLVADRLRAAGRTLIPDPIHLTPLTHNPQGWVHYVSEAGEERVFPRERLPDVRPPSIVVTPVGSIHWKEGSLGIVSEGRGTLFHLASPWESDDGPGVSIRVKDHAVDYHGAPVSRSLPRYKCWLPDPDSETGRRPAGVFESYNGHRVMRHPDGAITTLDGRPIVANRADAERQEGRSGLARED